MSQVTIYLDPETEKKMKAHVKRSGLSKSRWIAELIREKTQSARSAEVVELAGAWQDMPTAEAIREPLGSDTSREKL